MQNKFQSKIQQLLDSDISKIGSLNLNIVSSKLYNPGYLECTQYVFLNRN